MDFTRFINLAEMSAKAILERSMHVEVIPPNEVQENDKIC